MVHHIFLLTLHLGLFSGPLIQAAPSLLNSTLVSSSQPSTIVKRNQPIPTPKFVNFPNKSPKQIQLQQAFTDMYTMLVAVMDSSHSSVFNAVFPKYFQDVHRQAVTDILNGFLDPTNVEWLNHFLTIDAKDFDGGCNAGTGAYTKPVDGGVKQHYCDSTIYYNLFNLPKLDDIQCKNLDSYASYKMATLADTVFHECTHIDYLTQNTIGSFELPVNVVVEKKGKPQDIPSHILDWGYGPQETQKMRTDPTLIFQNNVDFTNGPVVNADSYTWFLTEAYMAIKCKKPFPDVPKRNRIWPNNVGTPLTKIFGRRADHFVK